MHLCPICNRHTTDVWYQMMWRMIRYFNWFSWRNTQAQCTESGKASPRESFSQGLAPWCSGEGVSFTPDLGSLSGSSDDSNPKSALARLPPADVEPWTDGSVVPGVGAGAGFVIYVNSLLYASEATQPALSHWTSVRRLSPCVWALLPSLDSRIHSLIPASEFSPIASP